MASDHSSPETRSSFLQRVGQHDPKSWEEFVALYEPLLRAYVGDCARRTQLGLSADDREDILQEVWIKLYRVLPSFELHGRFRTWLWRVTYHVVVDGARHRYGRRKLPAGPLRRAPVSLTPEMEELLAGSDEPPDEQIIRAHDMHLLRHILAKVKLEMQSAHKWDCFEMHYLEGEPSARVAETLGLSVNAVNTYTSRVLARIRELGREHEVEFRP
jgi:RNA polymerase sigma factor (sigma-70 family)